MLETKHQIQRRTRRTNPHPRHRNPRTKNPPQTSVTNHPKSVYANTQTRHRWRPTALHNATARMSPHVSYSADVGSQLVKTKRNPAIVGREPSGRAQRPANVNEQEFAPTQVKRLRDAALAGMRDPEWGSQLGRLFLTRAISPVQYAAAKRWRALANNYHNAIGVVAVRSINLQPTSKGYDCDPASEQGQRTAQRDRDALKRFQRAHDKLIETGSEKVVRALCERDESPAGFTQMQKLQLGLSTLARLWQLDRRN